MSTLDVPTPGRASFHRLNVRGLRDFLLVEEQGVFRTSSLKAVSSRIEAVVTYLRPVAYLMRPIGA